MTTRHAHSSPAPRPSILLALLLALIAGGCAQADWTPQDGDLVFQQSTSAQSEAIQRATGSRWSHVGLVFHHDGRPWVLEAVATVRALPLEEWTARGAGGRFVVARLRDANAALTPESQQTMVAHGHRLLGRPYDPQFRWDDDRLYCSELVWKVYAAAGVELCPLRSASDYDLDDPVVARAARARFGADLPNAEPIVAPADLLASPRLIEITRGRDRSSARSDGR